MSIIYGKDRQDSLFLMVYFINGNQYNVPNMKTFPRDFRNNKYIPLSFTEALINETKHFGQSYMFSKHDNYNFEDTVKQFKDKYRQNESSPLSIVHTPVFILKNDKWFYAGIDTDYMLIPTE